ncbi:MAG: NAD(P)/FAD-dependent oxidoreductase [Candidatus Marinimicrobia bacterium]|nr:NAD(P)/FAD-dependent oxidoreductase [Candidatus Neomarinimicrobiota bacterium]
MSAPKNIEASFDLLVVGAGPGGMAAATRGAMKGLSMGLVNGQRIWGYGIHGAYKSKGMYELAKDHMVAQKPGRGYVPAARQVDFHQVYDQLITGSEELEALYRQQIAVLGIHEIKGYAAFTDPQTVEVDGKLYRGKNVIIATGTKPRWLPTIEQDGQRIMSSDEIVSLQKLPESMLILGAGVIGCEFASIFNSFGCDVTLLDNEPAILSHEDDDVSEFITGNFSQNGINIIS